MPLWSLPDLDELEPCEMRPWGAFAPFPKSCRKVLNQRFFIPHLLRSFFLSENADISSTTMSDYLVQPNHPQMLYLQKTFKTRVSHAPQFSSCSLSVLHPKSGSKHWHPIRLLSLFKWRIIPGFLANMGCLLGPWTNLQRQSEEYTHATTSKLFRVMSTTISSWGWRWRGRASSFLLNFIVATSSSPVLLGSECWLKKKSTLPNSSKGFKLGRLLINFALEMQTSCLPSRLWF